MQALHQALHDAFKVRDQSPSRREAWHRAAQKFRDYRSEVDEFLDRIRDADIDGWAEAREFVFSYFAVDPAYFWSGHTKQWLIPKIRGLDLDEAEKSIIRDLIMGRIHNGAMREFRHFCRLIPRVQNKSFVDDLNHLSDARDLSVSSRARFALRYLKAADTAR